ncbi:hypothetical protein ABIA94_002820 [Bradyrhizobium sp. LA7.1]
MRRAGFTAQAADAGTVLAFLLDTARKVTLATRDADRDR